MEREELLQEVQGLIEADGKKLSPSISVETINAELDDELVNIGDDEEANKAVYSRIAKRLLRIDGNIHSNVSREVKAYKAKFKPAAPTTDGGKGADGGDDDDTPAWAKALTKRIDAIEESRKAAADAAAKDAIVDEVKKGLRAKFKSGKIDVNEYVYRQTLRDLEIPATEDGESVDTDALIRKMERQYYENLKEAGLDKRDTGKTHRGASGSGGSGKSRLDEMFSKKAIKEGWGKS